MPYQLLRLARLPVPPRSRNSTVPTATNPLQCGARERKGPGNCPAPLISCQRLLDAKAFHPGRPAVDVVDEDRDILPGLEVFDIHEHNSHQAGVEFRDARTGTLIFGKSCPDVGRGVAFDIDPRYPGYELWASGEGLSGVWNVKGEQVSKNKPRSCNFGVWWDGDLLRELLDSNRISKWDWIGETEKNLLMAEGCVSNNGTKSTPALCADILGDWREEVIWRTSDNKALRIYTTTIPTTRRLTTLLHDPQYRLSVAWQNVAYNQPTQPGFYLGEK